MIKTKSVILKKDTDLDKTLLTEKPISYPALTWTPRGQSPGERLHLRTRELASLEGHSPHEITQGNYEQAKREVTGESILSRQNVVLNAVFKE